MRQSPGSLMRGLGCHGQQQQEFALVGCMSRGRQALLFRIHSSEPRFWVVVRTSHLAQSVTPVVECRGGARCLAISISLTRRDGPRTDGLQRCLSSPRAGCCQGFAIHDSRVLGARTQGGGEVDGEHQAMRLTIQLHLCVPVALLGGRPGGWAKLGRHGLDRSFDLWWVSCALQPLFLHQSGWCCKAVGEIIACKCKILDRLLSVTRIRPARNW